MSAKFQTIFLRNTFLAGKFKKYLFCAKIQINEHFFGGKIQMIVIWRKNSNLF